MQTYISALFMFLQVSTSLDWVIWIEETYAIFELTIIHIFWVIQET